MAYGFARSLNRPAIVTATEGPGVTNLATGIGAAYKGYVPVISISGAQELFMREKDASQDIDEATFNRPITKWAYSIPSPGKVQEAVRKGVPRRARRAGRPGASRRFQGHPAAAGRSRADRRGCLPGERRAGVRGGGLDRAAALIGAAQRPVFLAGGGVLREDALPALRRLAEQTGIPVATLQYYPDAFPTAHPLALGPLGRNGFGSANRAVPQADLVIAIGAHLDFFSTAFKYGIISREAKLIHHSGRGGRHRRRLPGFAGGTWARRGAS